MKIVHFDTDSTNNCGDHVLSWCLRAVFGQYVPDIVWKIFHVQTECNDEIITEINQADLVIVGGGGLFLRDTGANSHSGWQWPIPLHLLHKIKTPLVLFGVGYNRFRNQPDFEPIFTEHINAVVEKAKFVGLRNHGSISAIQSYLKPELKSKIDFQPCPSVHLDKLTDIKPVWLTNNTLAINPGCDRPKMRFNGKEVFVDLDKLGHYCAQLGWDVQVIHNTPIEKDLKLKFPTLALYGKQFNEIISGYKQAAITVGMKGHGQLIPFGLGNAIISLVSHNKLQWFLDDVGESWGVDVSENIFEGLRARFELLIQDREIIHNKIQAAKARFWEQTEKNVEFILS